MCPQDPVDELSTLSPRQLAVLDALWRRAIAELTSFVEKHNRLPGRADVDYGSVNYKTWLTTRRRELKDGTMSSSRKADLDRVFPGWEIVRIQKDVWSQTVDETVGFVRLYGEPLLSSTNETELRLARWLDRQRELGKYGMTKVRYARLNTEFSDWELLNSDMNGFVCQGPMRIKLTHGESPYSGVEAAYVVKFSGDDEDLWVAANGAVAGEEFRDGLELRYINGFSMSREWYGDDLSLRAALRLPHLAVGMIPFVSSSDGEQYRPRSVVKSISKL